MAGVAEEHRRRIASALCLVGAGLILAGLALVLHHYETVTAGVKGSSQAPPHPSELVAQAIKQVLFWVLILMGVFGVSTFAFLRWSRRFRQWILHRPHPPTAADDLWAMHRLPGEGPDDTRPPGRGSGPGAGA